MANSFVMSARILPCVVRLLRNQTGIIQDCDIYLGPEWKKGDWNLQGSKWVRGKRQTLVQYEEQIRKSPTLMNSLGELSGQVLGCFCNNPVDCHGTVLIKLWKEKFPDYYCNPELAKTKYTVKTKKRKAPSSEKEPKLKVPKVLYRDQTTHPEGIRAEGSLHPWPITDHKYNAKTIYIDEAGMGCYAGPLHVGGVVLLPGFNLTGLHDSKLLKEHEREHRYEELIKCPHVICHVEVIDNNEIDELRLGEAWRVAIRRLSNRLYELALARGIKIEQILLDGNKMVSDTIVPVVPVTKGDRLYAGISAGSILAKTTRDRYMTDIAAQYPQFETIFKQGHGYRFNKEHDELMRQGIYTSLHRKSYNPLAAFLAKKIVIKRPHSPIARLDPGAPLVAIESRLS